MKNDPQTELIQEIQSLEPELIMRTMYPVDWQRLGEGFGQPQGYSGFQVHFMRISKVKKTIANISGTFVFILSYLPAAFYFINTWYILGNTSTAANDRNCL